MGLIEASEFDGDQLHIGITNKEAAAILRMVMNNRNQYRARRGNGQIMLNLEIDLAILKAIEVLEQTCDKQGDMGNE